MAEWQWWGAELRGPLPQRAGGREAEPSGLMRPCGGAEPQRDLSVFLTGWLGGGGEAEGGGVGATGEWQELQGAELLKATHLQKEAGEIKLTLILILSCRHLRHSSTLSPSLSSSSSSLNIKKLLDDIHHQHPPTSHPPLPPRCVFTLHMNFAGRLIGLRRILK